MPNPTITIEKVEGWIVNSSYGLTSKQLREFVEANVPVPNEFLTFSYEGNRVYVKPNYVKWFWAKFHGHYNYSPSYNSLGTEFYETLMVTKLLGGSSFAEIRKDYFSELTAYDLVVFYNRLNRAFVIDYDAVLEFNSELESRQLEIRKILDA